jgi:hypothetical protein
MPTGKNTAAVEQATEAADRTTVEKTTERSEQMFEQVEAGQRAAIEAVRKFMDSVDRALPPHGEGPSRRQEIIDSALEMSQGLVTTQYDFLRGTVHSAGGALGGSGKKK